MTSLRYHLKEGEFQILWFYIMPLRWSTVMKAIIFMYSSVQSLSHVQLFVTPWAAACQASLSITNSWSYSTAIWGKSCFLVHLAYFIPLAPQQSPWEWQHTLDSSFGSPHSHLMIRNYWWLWHFLLINMAGDIFISHIQHILWGIQSEDQEWGTLFWGKVLEQGFW